MAELRYPTGIQTFSDIIEGGYVYVDKTSYIKQLLIHGITPDTMHPTLAPSI